MSTIAAVAALICIALAIAGHAVGAEPLAELAGMGAYFALAVSVISSVVEAHPRGRDD